jgi:hypothetical protein
MDKPHAYARFLFNHTLYQLQPSFNAVKNVTKFVPIFVYVFKIKWLSSLY